MAIGDRIKAKRMERGWSQRDLAARMGYSHHSTLARIETGRVDVSQTRIAQFAEVLGCSIAYLMEWEQVQKNNDIQTDIVVRMRTDAEFYEVVKRIYELDAEKLTSLRQLLK